MGYNSAYIRDISEMFAYISGLWVCGVGLWNDASQILPRPTPVAMATKFETKPAITRLIYQISARSLRIAEVFGNGLLNDAIQILPRPTPVAMATEFGTKSPITRLISVSYTHLTLPTNREV